MYGANYYGSIYYAESYSKVYNLFIRSLTATVTPIVKLSKRVSITRVATTITIVSLVTVYQKALSRLVGAVTKALNYPRSSRALNYSRTTKRIP